MRREDLDHLIRSGWGRFTAGLLAMLSLAWMVGAKFTGVIDWESTIAFVGAVLAWAYSCIPNDPPREAATASPAPAPGRRGAAAVPEPPPEKPLVPDAPVADVARYLREEAGFASASDDQIGRTIVDVLANPGLKVKGWVRDSEHSALVARSISFWSEARLDVRTSLAFEPMLYGEPLPNYDPHLNWNQVRAVWPKKP
ncbi:hypothetical protein [Brevundimonas bacteroides]|uniref:hypothetical protein n=1 Tax=Brevundimonas bacteroides TaxID=74311 RepID=UPI000494DEA4|nr:hypothetical protein [Brevundimonas bacteroides]